MGQKKIVVAPIFLLLNRACCNIGHTPEILQVYTTHTTYSWNSAKSALRTLHIPEILWSLHNTQAGRCYTKKPVYTTLEPYPIVHNNKNNNTDPFTPPVQKQKQQQQHWVLWHLLYSNRNNNSGSFHGASSLTVGRKLGRLKRKKQAAAAQRDLEQLCQFQQRGATSGLSHKNLNPGFNTANRIPSQHWFGVLKVCLCLFFYIATSDDCTSAGMEHLWVVELGCPCDHMSKQAQRVELVTSFRVLLQCFSSENK
jgi:hypothetical protein